jgi:S-adenosylmethionine uptake transporter
MTKLSDNTRGALLMVGSMAFFTFNDACFKALGADLPFMQALFLRAALVTVILAVAVWATGGLRLSGIGSDGKLLAMRTLADVASAYFFLTALLNMPLADATAIIQVLPLTVTLGAALLFREKVGWRRLLAIGVGFIGVMLIVQPGGAGFSIYSVYALAAVVSVTSRDLLTRRMRSSVPTLTITLCNAAGVMVFAGIGSLFEVWEPLRGSALWLLLGSAGFVLLAYVCSVATMRVGDVGFVAPFRYTSLVVALILGLLVFGDWPDGLTLLGSAIVVATGLFTLLRERALARRGAHTGS